MPQYLKSLLDPENNLARIPDDNCYKSSVFQVVTMAEITTQTDGSAGYMFSPQPINPTTTNYSATLIGTAIETTATVGVWGTTTTVTPPSSATVLATMNAARVVSGCICAEYVGDTNTDAGTICCLPIFRGESAPNRLSVAETFAYNQSYPLRNGCRMLYRPMDNGDLEYHGPTDASSWASGAYGINLVGGTGLPKNSDPNLERAPVCFCIMVSGATASKKVLRVRAVFNYEGIPLLASLGLFAAKKEESNPTVLASAMNAASSLPWGDVWQGVGGTLGKIGQEMAQSAFSSATSMAGAALLNSVRKRGGWRTSQQIGWTSDFGGGDLGID